VRAPRKTLRGMNVTEQLAAFASGVDAAALPAARGDLLRLHIFDTIGAWFAGDAVGETADVRSVIGDDDGATLLLGCIAARCSEIDDIHLASCITPGAVVIPTALVAAAELARAGTPVDDAAFLAACVAGYETLLRFGLAVDGPRILYRGVWPTYVCSGFGVVATLGRLQGLDATVVAEALAIVATRATGTSGRIPGRTSRWLTLGCAARDAALAVRAAQRGLHGDLTLLDGRWSAITAVALERDALLGDLGVRFELDAVSFKPVCAAKQTIAAIQGFREIVAGGVDADGARSVTVTVPSSYREMIDRTTFPVARQDSLSNVRYSLALAVAAPERLLDVHRSELIGTPRVRALMAKVDVAIDPALDAAYPRDWPARVIVTAGDGTVHERTVMRPFGDPGTGFGWDAAAEKFAAIAPRADGAAVAAACRGLGNGTLPVLLAAAANRVQ
jgi:2-methylcitrate dehydratase PrpD